MEDKLNMPGAVITKITNSRTLNYTVGEMSMNFTVDPSNMTNIEDLLDILTIAKSDLEEMINEIGYKIAGKVYTTHETRSESTDSVQPVSEGAEA